MLEYKVAQIFQRLPKNFPITIISLESDSFNLEQKVKYLGYLCNKIWSQDL